MRRAPWILAAGLLLAGTGGALAQGAGEGRMDTASPLPFAELQGLDKVTARVSTFVAPVGQPVTFGSLTLDVLACWKNPPERTPESAAYLEVRDGTEGSRTIFSGWMYASSPAINALEHPVYDVWVLDCLPTAGAGQDGEAQPGETQPGGAGKAEGG